MRVWLPLDSFALAMGGEEVAAAIMAEAKARGVDVTLTRNGSRGMAWLEPLAEGPDPADLCAGGRDRPAVAGGIPGAGRPGRA